MNLSAALLFALKALGVASFHHTSFLNSRTSHSIAGMAIRQVGVEGQICHRMVHLCPKATTQLSSSPGDSEEPKKTIGDPLREATGIRPSLHPTTINALADALRDRARKTDGMNFRTTDTVTPIEIAMTAGNIAATAIARRQQTSDQDGMTLTQKEEQTIAGRILGVIVRLDFLEQSLQDKVEDVDWIAKYNDWGTFGTLSTKQNSVEAVDQRIKDDPLFAVSRAECLLAIFLHTIESPQLASVGESVPDGSKVDFLDEDRREVLLQSA